MDLQLKGRTALVTGVGSKGGIGFAIARELCASMSAAIRRLVTDDELRHRFAAFNREHAVVHTWEHALRALDSAYARAAAGRSRSVAVRRTSITRVPARGYAARRSARPNTADAPKWTFACRRYAHVMNVVRPLDDQRFVDPFCSMRVQTRMAPYTDAKGSQSWSVDVHFFGSQLSPLQ